MHGDRGYDSPDYGRRDDELAEELHSRWGVCQLVGDEVICC